MQKLLLGYAACVEKGFANESARIKTFNPTPEKPFVLGLPTGSSPEIIYKILVRRYRAGDISFKNIVTFNMVRDPTVS